MCKALRVFLPSACERPVHLELDDVWVDELLEKRDLAQSRSGDAVILQLHLDFLFWEKEASTAEKHPTPI